MEKGREKSWETKPHQGGGGGVDVIRIHEPQSTAGGEGSDSRYRSTPKKAVSKKKRVREDHGKKKPSYFLSGAMMLHPAGPNKKKERRGKKNDKRPANKYSLVKSGVKKEVPHNSEIDACFPRNIPVCGKSEGEQGVKRQCGQKGWVVCLYEPKKLDRPELKMGK